MLILHFFECYSKRSPKQIDICILRVLSLYFLKWFMYMQFSYKLKCKIRRLESEKQIKKKKSVNMALIRFHGTLTSPALCDIFSLFF